MSSIYNALAGIQQELKAPKGQKNTFGNYKYRNCEDILEALKPLLNAYNSSLQITDSIEMIGDRFYVKATVILYVDDGESIQNVAYARESLEKKGMDASQITGAASSYARKYALNGLFLIDDTKDADSMDNTINYSDIDLKVFKDLYNAGNGYRFVLFKRHIGIDLYMELVKALPGKKADIKATLSNLEHSGNEDIQEVVNDTTKLVESNDAQWDEELRDLEDYEKNVLFKAFPKEIQTKMKGNK